MAGTAEVMEVEGVVVMVGEASFVYTSQLWKGIA